MEELYALKRVFNRKEGCIVCGLTVVSGLALVQEALFELSDSYFKVIARLVYWLQIGSISVLILGMIASEQYLEQMIKQKYRTQFHEHKSILRWHLFYFLLSLCIRMYLVIDISDWGEHRLAVV